MSLHQFLEEFQFYALVSTFSDDRFKHLTFVTNGSPMVVTLDIRLHENLVNMPLPFQKRAKTSHPLSSDIRSKQWAEPVPLITDGYVAHIDPTLAKQIFDIPKRNRKSIAQRHRQADKLGTGFKVFEEGSICRP